MYDAEIINLIKEAIKITKEKRDKSMNKSAEKKYYRAISQKLDETLKLATKNKVDDS